LNTLTIEEGIVNLVENNRLKVYPNPASDHLIFENTSDKMVIVRIENSLGQIVDVLKIAPSKNTLLETQSWPAGIYSVRSPFDNGQMIVIQR
jgi:hypothetical protein